MFIQNIRKSSYLLFFFISTFFINPVFSQDKTEVVNLIWQGIGGKQSWDEARYFMFSCKTNIHQLVPGEHSYIWDRVSGNCRFEGTDSSQGKVLALFNAKSREGKIFVNDQAITDQDSAKVLLETIVNAFYSDSFWLFPSKNLADPSQLVLRDQELIGSTRYYVVEILLRNKHYGEYSSKLFIDTNTGRVYQWQALSDDGNIMYNFLTSSFKDVGGGLMLATALMDEKTGITINYPIVSALINVEEDKFIKP
jgi:hypothetical protein